MKFYKISIYVSIVINSIFFAQSQNKEAVIKEIDSLVKVYKYNTTPEGLKNNHYTLRKAKAISYTKGILKSYIRLMWLHGKNKRLDSTLYYDYQFENLKQVDSYKDLRVEYLFNKGILLNNYLGLTEQALNSYMEAYNLIDPENITEKSKIETAIAICYINKKQYDKAVSLLSKYLKDITTIKLRYRVTLLTTIAMAYQYKKMPEKSFPLHQKLLELTKNNHSTHGKFYAQNHISYDYYLMGDYQKAIDSGLAVRKNLKKSIIPDEKSINSEFLSIFYNAIGDIENAIYYSKDAIRNTARYNKLPELYKSLSQYYEANKQTKLALESYKKREKVLDSIRSMEQRSFIDYYDTKIKFIHEKQDKKKIILEKNILATKNSRQKLYIISLLIGLACIILSILIFVIYRKYYNSKKEVVALKQNEKEMLKHHIEIRENELTANLMLRAKKIIELKEIKKTLAEGIKYNDNAKIIASEKSLQQFLTEMASYDSLLSERVESQYPGIVHQLQHKHPELSSNAIKHCLLVKLGLSLKESAQLLNVTVGTVKTSRNRAKLQLNLPKEISLKAYITQISGDTLAY